MTNIPVAVGKWIEPNRPNNYSVDPGSIMIVSKENGHTQEIYITGNAARCMMRTLGDVLRPMPMIDEA